MAHSKKKPWFRDQDGWWYGQVGTGSARCQQRLVEGKDKGREARRLYKQLLEEGDELTTTTTLKRIFIAFLRDHAKESCSKDTYRWYRHFLKSCSKVCGSVRYRDLKPAHVQRWLKRKKGWGETTRNRAITCVKVAVNWFVKANNVPVNRLVNLKKPAMLPRERITTAAERRTVLSAVKDQAFKLVLFALGATGARPSEVRRVTAAEYMPAGLWVFPPRKHKTGKKTRKPRVIYLTEPMKKLCEKLARERPTGPLFLNSRGKPWTCNALRCRFRQLRKKFPELQGVTAYVYRHTFTTDGLAAGVPIAQMQELRGHQSPAMMAHYAHLGQKMSAMRAAASQATRRPQE